MHRQPIHRGITVKSINIHKPNSFKIDDETMYNQPISNLNTNYYNREIGVTSGSQNTSMSLT